MRQRVTRDYGIKDTYSIFTLKEKIDYETYSRVCKKLNKEFMQLMITENSSITMPYLGKIFLEKYKPKTLKGIKHHVDYGSTLKLWRSKYGNLTMAEFKKIENKPLLKYENEHSNGFKIKLNWDKTMSDTKGKYGYIFLMTRANKRYLAKLLKEKVVDFYEKINW